MYLISRDLSCNATRKSLSFLQPFFEELSNDIYQNFDKIINDKFIEAETLDYLVENIPTKSKNEFLKLMVTFASNREKVSIQICFVFDHITQGTRYQAKAAIRYLVCFTVFVIGPKCPATMRLDNEYDPITRL